MTRLFTAVGEKLLHRAAPKATAEAYWDSVCYCVARMLFRTWCWQSGNDVDCECRVYCYQCCFG